MRNAFAFIIVLAMPALAQETFTVATWNIENFDQNFWAHHLTHPEPVWKEIFQQRTPLGEILLRHNILQTVQPKWFLRFDTGSTILEWMKAKTDKPYYGRLGTIYCNGEPAVEVLEIVTGA